MAVADPILRFEGVSKRYRLGLTRTSLPTLISKKLWGQRNGKAESEAAQYLWALKDVSFQLSRGESLALVGSNGAGKTTILKLLARITKPYSGEIETRGRLSALVELGAGFHPELSGAENVYLNGAILGLTKQEVDRRFKDIVAFSELERFMGTPLKRYSSGMVVRLGFAVASCIEPEILLVDEVLAVGDAAFRQKCINRINQLLHKGTSIIFVSHNLWLVQNVCKSALYLESGKVRLHGETSKVVEAYEDDLHRARAAKLNLPETRQEDFSGGCEITGVEVLPEEKGGELRPDKPARIRVRYLSYDDESRCSVVLRIIRSDGVTCLMVRSKLDEFDLRLERGENSFSLRLEPLQLRGGTYYAQAWLRDVDDLYTLSTRSSDFFSVFGSKNSFSEMNGVFEPNRSWSHRETVDFRPGANFEAPALEAIGGLSRE